MASSMLQSTSHLNDSAATARACSLGAAAVLGHDLQGVLGVARRLGRAGPGSTPGRRGRSRYSSARTRRAARPSDRARTARSATTRPPRPTAACGRTSRRRRRRTARRARRGAGRATSSRVSPQRLAQAQPGLDAALPVRRAVVVDDAADPAAPDLAVGAVRQDRRVLERDVLLVVEAVGHPAPDLAGGQSRPRSSARGRGAASGSAATGRAAASTKLSGRVPDRPITADDTVIPPPRARPWPLRSPFLDDSAARASPRAGSGSCC